MHSVWGKHWNISWCNFHRVWLRTLTTWKSKTRHTHLCPLTAPSASSSAFSSRPVDINILCYFTFLNIADGAILQSTSVGSIDALATQNQTGKLALCGSGTICYNMVYNLANACSNLCTLVEICTHLFPSAKETPPNPQTRNPIHGNNI